MKQAIKNIWWQIKSVTIARFRWEPIQIDLDDRIKDFLIDRSCETGESVEQIVHGLLRDYIRRIDNESKRTD